MSISTLVRKKIAEAEPHIVEVHDDVYGEDRDQFSAKIPKSLVLSVVVLGASGDLAHKKTFPALFELYHRGLFPSNTQIFGYARSALTDESLRTKIKTILKGDQDKIDAFCERVKYVQGQYDKDEDFQRLQGILHAREHASLEDLKPGLTGLGASPFGRLYYLALPPSVYASVCKMLRANCSTVTPSITASPSWLRIIVEKPFGRDLESSEELGQQLNDLFPESVLYRIDHYLGKEIAQNIMVMRFANVMYAPIWNRQYIHNVQITMKEPFGVEGRAGYFDKSGIIRDIIQNHLMQILALVAMERPVSLHPDDIRDEKVKVLRSMNVAALNDCIIGQYTGNGDHPGYLDDPEVPNDSNTPTFAVCVLRIDNDRWEGVPFIIKAGKALNERKAEVRIQFQPTPAFLYGDAQGYRNELVMRLQPNESIYMKMVVKQPGLDEEVTMSELDLSYRERYEDTYIPEAYERLILDCIRGDQQHFVRRDELRAAWQIFTPLLHAIDNGNMQNVKYEYGSRGPREADGLVTDAGFVKNFEYTWSPSRRSFS